MQLEINRKLLDDLNNANKLKMKLANRKMNRVCIVFGFLGVIFFLIGVLNFDVFGDFFMSAGFVHLLLAGWFFYQTSVITGKFLETAKKNIADNKDGIVITMDDLIFTYRDAQSYVELKWSVFTGYKLFGDYLFLIKDNNLASSYIINKNELSRQDFSDLISFLSNRMIETK